MLPYLCYITLIPYSNIFDNVFLQSFCRILLATIFSVEFDTNIIRQHFSTTFFYRIRQYSTQFDTILHYSTEFSVEIYRSGIRQHFQTNFIRQHFQTEGHKAHDKTFLNFFSHKVNIFKKVAYNISRRATWQGIKHMIKTFKNFLQKRGNFLRVSNIIQYKALKLRHTN